MRVSTPDISDVPMAPKRMRLPRKAAPSHEEQMLLLHKARHCIMVAFSGSTVGSCTETSVAAGSIFCAAFGTGGAAGGISRAAGNMVHRHCAGFAAGSALCATGGICAAAGPVSTAVGLRLAAGRNRRGAAIAGGCGRSGEGKAEHQGSEGCYYEVFHGCFLLV